MSQQKYLHTRRPVQWSSGGAFGECEPAVMDWPLAPGASRLASTGGNRNERNEWKEEGKAEGFWKGKRVRGFQRGEGEGEMVPG